MILTCLIWAYCKWQLSETYINYIPELEYGYVWYVNFMMSSWHSNRWAAVSQYACALFVKWYKAIMWIQKW